MSILLNTNRRSSLTSFNSDPCGRFSCWSGTVTTDMSGEFDFIDWIRRQTTPHEHVLVPPGDDLAVLKWPADELLIVGVDQVLDTVHFDSTVHPPRDIGRKVMN